MRVIGRGGRIIMHNIKLFNIFLVAICLFIVSGCDEGRLSTTETTEWKSNGCYTLNDDGTKNSTECPAATNNSTSTGDSSGKSSESDNIVLSAGVNYGTKEKEMDMMYKKGGNGLFREYKDNLVLKPGETVDFLFGFSAKDLSDINDLPEVTTVSIALKDGIKYDANGETYDSGWGWNEFKSSFVINKSKLKINFINKNSKKQDSVADGRVFFRAKLPSASSLSCGANKLEALMSLNSQSKAYSKSIFVTVVKECEK
jgi:hypothetical protein